MGPLSPINDLAGVLIQQYSDDLEETIEMVVQRELAEAKEVGLKGVQRFVLKNHLIFQEFFCVAFQTGLLIPFYRQIYTQV